MDKNVCIQSSIISVIKDNYYDKSEQGAIKDTQDYLYLDICKN